MKKRAMVLLLMTAVSISALQGCSGNKNDDTNDANRSDDDITPTEEMENDFLGTESILDNTENVTSQLQLGNAVEIPEGWEGKVGETDAHGELEKVIAEYCNVPEENYRNVRYYYNYVDLNGDGTDEILALVLGENVGELDGNTLLWVQSEDENLSKDSVRQAFSQVNAPIYISDHMTEGYRDLIVRNDGGVSGIGTAAATDQETNGDNTNHATVMERQGNYTLLVWKDDRYQDLSEGENMEDLEGYEGIAILTNNMENDLQTDNYHFLGEAMQ